MADKKISELDQVLQINNDAAFPMSQDSGGTPTTYKATITQIGAEIGEEQTFSNLQTTSKNLVGAINELNQGGGGGGSSNANLAPDYDATSTYAVGDWCIYNGTLYQCNTAIPTAEAFDPTHWTAKKVVDAFDDIENELDDKVDTTDFSADIMPIESGSATNTKDYIDTGLSGKEDSITYESDDYNVATYGGVIRCKKWGRVVNIQGYGLGTVTNMSTVQAYTMATIASKYRPITQQHIIGSMNAGSYATGSAQGYRINTDGTVVTYVYNGTKIENGYFNVTYII